MNGHVSPSYQPAITSSSETPAFVAHTIHTPALYPAQYKTRSYGCAWDFPDLSAPPDSSNLMFVSRFLAAAALAATVSAHATWQQLWINGVDYGSACVRKPNSNSPVSVTSSVREYMVWVHSGTDNLLQDMNCNAAASSAANTCAVKAGDTIRVEMHQQAGDRSCSSEAIGGQHYGPSMFTCRPPYLYSALMSLHSHGISRQGCQRQHGGGDERGMVQDCRARLDVQVRLLSVMLL